MTFRTMAIASSAFAAGLAVATSAFAQNLGGIEGFKGNYPIQTYDLKADRTGFDTATKLLRANDVGPIEDVLILSALSFGGKGYVELEVRSGDYWVSRADVLPRKRAVVDKAIDDSNGAITCPKGTTRVAKSDPRDERAGVARNLGGVSGDCVKKELQPIE